MKKVELKINGHSVRIYNADFNESDHPRDGDGKFSSGSGGGSSPKSDKGDDKMTASNPRIAGFDVKKETDKAYLLSDQGKDFWIQKRWVGKEGNLTKSGEKAHSEALAGEGVAQYKQREYEIDQKLKKDGVKIKVKPDWESDKAVGYDFIIEHPNSERTSKERVFIPKSQIKDGKIPYWLHKAKMDELRSKMRGDAYIESGGYYDDEKNNVRI